MTRGRVLGVAAIVCGIGALSGCGEARAPLTLADCLRRPRDGFASPALRRRVRDCRTLIARAGAPAYSGLASVDSSRSGARPHGRAAAGTDVRAEDRR